MEYFAMLFVCCSATIVSSEPSTTKQKPNIVFILSDDFGFNDIGYHAKDHLSLMKTPNLDKLAEDGIKLENYYVQPVCSPTRSQLMSGRYQIHTGLQHGIIQPDQAYGLPLDNIILPEQLRQCGYDTHMVGKWHLGYYKTEYLPWKRGFNSFYGFLTGSENYYTREKRWPGGRRGIDFWSSENGLINSTWGEYSAHLFAKRADDIIIQKRDKTKPLFLYVAFQSVHGPMQVPEKYVKSFSEIKDPTRRIYGGMVAAMDESVANITRSLKDADMLDNTIIIFSTDNGGANSRGGNNWPLKGAKSTYWEGGIRGVGFIHGKPLPTHGVKSNQLIHVSDWLPTILSATECPLVGGTPSLDGFDQWSAILENTTSPRNEILHNIDPLCVTNHYPLQKFDSGVRAAIRVGAWKLLTGVNHFGDWVPPPESGEPRVRAKSKTGGSPQEIQLYNIESDPYEEREISHEHPSIVEDLLSKLAKYNRTAVPVRYPPHDRNAHPTEHRPFWGPWLD